MRIFRQLYEIAKTFKKLSVILIVECLDKATLSLQTNVVLDHCLHEDEIWLL